MTESRESGKSGKSESKGKQKLLLLGAGHAHMVAMRQWLDQGVELPKDTVLINPQAEAWYSGMMPGLIADRFAQENCLISLKPLCNQLGIEFQLRQVVSLDMQSQSVWFRDGGSLPFSLLSINCGSIPQPLPSDGAIPILPVKPFADFFRRWHSLMHAQPAIRKLAIVGGGAAGVEIALSVSANPSLRDLKVSVYADQQILPDYPPNVARNMQALLAKRGVSVTSNARVAYCEHGILYRDDNTSIADADLVIVATGATALPWYHNDQLETDADSFICVEPTLLAKQQQHVFVSGDACSLPGNPRAGVYAVRHGELLAKNILAKLSGEALEAYHPQPRALALLSTGNGGAVARYGKQGASCRLLRPVLGRWKDWLDQSYIHDHSL